jgi:outer membrane protein assembly factor BamB
MLLVTERFEMTPRAFRLPLFWALGVLLSCVAIAPAANWPRFRGPNGAGIAADKNIPVKWSEKEGILWKTALPGVGHSSPVVWGDRLFLESATPQERVLLCVDVSDGKILWQKSIPGTTTRKHPKNSFASSTPATDGQRAYAIFWTPDKITLYAYDFKGELAWKRDLDGPFRARHGVGCSPIVYGDKVFVNNDQTGAAVLLALEAKTGKIAWSVKRKPFRSCYSTPFVLERPEQKPELIVGSTAGITSYEPDTGAENWRWTWSFANMPLRTVGSPVYGQGIVFVGSGDGSGERNMVAVKIGGKGDVTETNFVWGRKRDFPYVPSMLIWGEHLYCVNDHGIATCTVAKTGKTVWEKRLHGKVTASPIIVDGKIYAVTEDGDVYVFPAAPKFQQLARNSLGEGVLATPAVANNRLYIRGESQLLCIGKKLEK